MRLINNSNYIIYFDKTRVDRFAINFDTNLGLTPTEAVASVTMLNANSLSEWKAYLTEVRIFVQNAYTGLYTQVFTGDIVGMSDSASRASTGRITYQVKGLFSWLDIPVPMYIQNMDNLNVLRRFQLQAQNIDVEAVTSLLQNRQDLFGTDKTIEQIIIRLFQLLDQGYTRITDKDTAFGFKDLLTKFKVMSDIDPKFRDKGFLDLTTFTQATTLQGFYDYLYTILTQMMLEFYQDRDGSLRIKGPSWNDAIPRAHILDESVVGDISTGTTWDEQPTRVLAIGGKNEILEAASNGDPIDGLSTSMSIPVGLYINGGQYIGMHFESFLKDGVSSSAPGGLGPVEGWFDDLSSRKVYPAATYLSKEYERLKINGGKPHYGTDYYMEFEQLNSQGVDGVVEENRVITGGGNTITIKQNINGQTYYLTYMHLNALPPFKKGDAIKAGQKIGTTGGSGIGPPHLHFQVWKGGFDWGNQRALTVDPEKFLKEMATAVQTSSAGVTAGGGSLLGTKDYKGPDSTSSGYTKGIKTKLNNCSKFDNIVKAAAAKHGINPMMLKVMMVMESGGDPNADGPNTKYGKAWGLLQIIPGAVDIKVTQADLVDPVKHMDAACRVMKAKAIIIKSKGLPQTVANAAHFWYGYLDSGLPYKKAFSEIYEGFPGLKATDSLFMKTAGTTGPTAQNTSVGPRVSGPQAPTSFRMATQMVQALAVQPEAGGGSSSRPTSPSNPYSAGGGFTSGTTTPDPAKNQNGKPVNVPNGKNAQKFVLPSGYGWLASTIKENGNGLDQNLVWAIIKAASNISARTKRSDDQKDSPEEHYGLMGIPASYMQQNGLSEAEMFDPAKNIYHGTKLYKECYAATKKHSFALLAYFLGGAGLTVIDAIKDEAVNRDIGYSFVDMLHLIEGSYDAKRKSYYLFDYESARFTDTAPPVQRVVMNWVQGTLDHYCALFGGNYVKGDPHRPFKDVVTYYARPSGVTVGIDAAAGGSTNGNVANSLTEKTLTLSVAQSVKGHLEGTDNVTVVMSRDSDTAMTIKERATRLKNGGANQIFGIVFGKGGEGVTVYTNAGASVGARTLQEKVGKLIAPVAEKHGVKYNGRKTSNSSLLRELGSKSAIIISLGHLDNERDATMIRGGLYLEDMGKAIASAIVNVTNLDGNQASASTAPAANTQFPDFFEKYKPQLSAEEKKYKMKFAAVEMELIRAGGETGGDLAAAEAYLEQYAKYITHVLRARATGLTVACNHAMPMLRPGFNAWLEPTRRNRVFYVTGIRHSGAFQSGVQTVVNGAYTRRTKDFDTKFNDNLFVSVTNHKAADLMPVITEDDMPTIRQKLKSIHASGQVIETGGNTYLKTLYAAKENPDKSLVQGEWNGEMTESQIEAKIEAHFKDAPACVKERIQDTIEAVRGARDLYDEFMRG